MPSSRQAAASGPALARRVLRFALYLLLGFVSLWWWTLTAPNLNGLVGGAAARGTLPLSLVTLLLIPVAILALTILVHELGHLVVSLLVGFRFVMFTAGPLKIYADGPRLRVAWHWKLALGGMSLCVPRNPAKLQAGGLERRVAAMVMAGPLANLGLAGVAAVLARQPGSDVAGALFLSGLAFLSGLMGLINLIPLRANGLSADGQRAWDLLRGTPDARRWVALWSLLAFAAGGVRPRDQDFNLITQALTLPDDSVDHISAVTWAYYAAFDRQDWAEARRWLHELEERLGVLAEGIRASYLLEVAFFAAAIDRDAPRARALLAQAKRPLLPSESTQARVDAALLLAEDQPGQAIQRAREALAALDRDQNPGMAIAERDWVQALIATADQAVV